MGIDLRPVLPRTEEQTRRNGRLQWRKEYQRCGQVINYDSWILLPIRPTERRIHGDRGSHQEHVLFYFFHKAEQSNADYHEDFMAMLEVIEEYGGAGSMTHFPNMPKREIEADGTDMSNATTD